MSREKVIPFDRDPWPVEALQMVHDLLIDTRWDYADIAMRVDRGAEETTAHEVGCLISSVQRKWSKQVKPDRPEQARCVQREMEERFGGRKPITPHKVEPPALNLISDDGEVSEISKSNDDSITIIVRGDTSEEDIDQTKPVFLYLMGFKLGEWIGYEKVGISNFPERRKIDLCCSVPAAVDIISRIEIPAPYDPRRLEALVHQKLTAKDLHLRRELFQRVDRDVFHRAYSDAIAEYSWRSSNA